MALLAQNSALLGINDGIPHLGHHTHHTWELWLQGNCLEEQHGAAFVRCMMAARIEELHRKTSLALQASSHQLVDMLEPVVLSFALAAVVEKKAWRILVEQFHHQHPFCVLSPCDAPQFASQKFPKKYTDLYCVFDKVNEACTVLDSKHFDIESLLEVLVVVECQMIFNKPWPFGIIHILLECMGQEMKLKSDTQQSPIFVVKLKKSCSPLPMSMLSFTPVQMSMSSALTSDALSIGSHRVRRQQSRKCAARTSSM